jgi:hypothetical protein
MNRSVLFASLAASILLTAAGPASAQNRDRQIRGMIQTAMEDYQNLDVDGALNRLRLALSSCGQRNCSPNMLARVHIAIGVVAVGGQNDSNTGIQEFEQALRLDPNAEPDAMLVTPEITAAFQQAQRRAGSGGGNSGNTGNGDSSGSSGNNGGSGNSGGDSGGTSGDTGGSSGMSATLLHTAVSEQLENTPIPVFIEPPAGLSAASVKVHFKGLGMSRFAESNMARIANGYGVEIACGQVIAPHLDYYVTAHDAAGTVIGSAGSEDQPFRVSIVRARTRPAPALPGRMPPETCGEDCPPGMTGPQCRRGGGAGSGGQRQLGDPCDNNDQCGSGMVCREGSCSSDGGGEGGGGGGGSSEFYRVGFELGFGAGFGLLLPSTLNVPAGLVTDADGNPDSRERSRYQRGVFYAEGRYDVVCNRDLDTCALFGTQEAADLLAGGGFRLLGTSSGSVVVDGVSYVRPEGDTCLDGFQCPRLSGAGLTPGFFLNAAVRVNVMKNLGFGFFTRFNPDFATASRPGMDAAGRTIAISNNGVLPMMLLGGRAYYAVTANGFAREGLSIAPFVGGGFGQIQVRPWGVANAAHVRSGTLNVHGGARVEYGFMQRFHVGADASINLQLPVTARAPESFLVVLDFAANIGMHF